MSVKEKINKNHNSNSRRHETTVLRELGHLLLEIAVIAGAVLIVFTFMFGAYRCTENGMTPAVKDGDLIFYYRLDKKYIASDIVIFRYKGEEQIRRVVAVAGDVVDIREDGLLINGSLQQEYQIYFQTDRYESDVKFPVTVPEGEVFVLGDYRKESTDSRIYGTVKIEDTQGKLVTLLRRRNF